MGTSQVTLRIDDDLKSYYSELVDHHKGSLHRQLIKGLEFGKNKKSHITTAVSSILDSVELPEVLRINSTSTTFDRDRIMTIIRSLETERLFFGVRQEFINKAVLVFIAETKNKTFLFDKTLLNMARRPREWEIADLFKVIEEQGDWQKLEFFSEYLPETLGLSAEEAWNRIFEQERNNDFEAYINLLSRGYYDKEMFARWFD